jgi:uncharacterized SAM-binding protein YcdF (DUF218 family)
VRRVLLALVAGWALCLAAIFVWSTRDVATNADAIVVLGAAQYGGRPSPVLQARLDHGLKLYKGARAKRVVLPGGGRDGDNLCEAAAGRRYLVRRGVPAEAIVLEAAGRTSLASVHLAARLLHTHRDSLPPRPKVLLVSDPFHMLRLDVLARLEGLDPLPSPTRTSPISANPARAFEYMLRESIALPADVALTLWMKLTGKEVAGIA